MGIPPWPNGARLYKIGRVLCENEKSRFRFLATQSDFAKIGDVKIASTSTQGRWRNIINNVENAAASTQDMFTCFPTRAANMFCSIGEIEINVSRRRRNCRIKYQRRMYN